MKKYPPKEEIAASFYYEEGKLLNKISRNYRCIVGEEAGGLLHPIGHPGCYRYIKIAGVGYMTHRLIWILHNGDIPEGIEIDHINGNKLDNRIENLRAVSHMVNMRNQKKRKDNSSGEMGISYYTKIKKWVARCSVNGKEQYLGCFLTKEAAIQARLVALTNIGYHPNHGRR